MTRHKDVDIKQDSKGRTIVSCFFSSTKQIQFKMYTDGTKYHRLDGPAYIEYNMDGNIINEEYYVDGKKNRIDGPAAIYYDHKGEERVEVEEYYKDDELHRDKGPAVIAYNKSGKGVIFEHWINGVRSDPPTLCTCGANYTCTPNIHSPYCDLYV